MTQYATVPGGTSVFTRDATANDSDKTFTVPVGKQWDLQYMECSITATAVAGNRSLSIRISNATPALIFTTRSTGNITANQVGTYTVIFKSDAQTDATAIVELNGVATANASLQMCGPNMRLPAGYSVRVYDQNAVDAAADDMIVVLHYIEYDA